MKKLLLLSGIILLGLNSLKAQDSWLNNVMGGFDNNNYNTLSNGLNIYNNQLYAATGSDSGYVYRTSTGQRNSWQKVFYQPNLTTVNAISSTSSNFYVSGYFGYNSTTATNPDSTVIYRSADGETNWTPYFQFQGIAPFIIPFKGSGTVDSIYVVKNGVNGSEIWKNDQLNTGNSWTQTLGFAGVGSYTITSNCIHNNKLYIGTNIGSTSIPTLWSSSNGNNWTKVITSVFDTTNALSAMTSFGGYLYVGTQNYNGAQIWKTNDEITWTFVGQYPGTYKVTSLRVISGKLYASLEGEYMGNGGAIVKDVSANPYNYSMNNGFGLSSEKCSNGSIIEFGNNIYFACGYYDIGRTQTSRPNGSQIWKLCLTTPPAVTLGPDITVCAGVSHTFDPGPGFSGYVWCDYSTNQTLSNSYPQAYSVTVMGANGCENEDTVLLKNIPSPSISGNYFLLPPLCKGDTLVPINVSATTNLRDTLPSNHRILTNPLTIYDYTSTYDTLMVSGITNDDGAQNTLVSVTIDSLFHSNNSDLVLRLISPSGSSVTLANYGYGQNFIGTVFTADAPNNIYYSGNGPYTGSFYPIDAFNFYLNGATNGSWVLQITDNYGGNTGVLKGWSVVFSQVDTNVTFSWSPATGLSSTTSSTVLAYPLVSTVYTLTATNSTNGCSSYDSVRVDVPELKINPHAAHICTGYSDSLSAEIVGLSLFGEPNMIKHHWSNNAGLTDTIAYGITVTPNSTTTYYAMDTISGCYLLDSTDVNVSPLMTIDAGMPQTICLNDTATLTANVLSGGISPFTFIWNDGGTNYTGQIYQTSPTTGTSYTLTVTDDWGCSTGGGTSVSVNPLPIITTSANATTVCFGENIYLTASGATTYNWDNGIFNGISFVPATSTTYHVTGTDNNGCKDTSSISISVNPLPIVVANTPTPIVCYNSFVTLTGSGADSYTWDNGITDGIPFIPSASGSYNVIGADANGCADTATIFLTLNPPLLVTSSGNPSTICFGDSSTITTTATGGTPSYNYSWDDGSATYGNATNVVTPLVSTSYTLTVTDAVGCLIYDTTTVSVTPSTDIFGHVDSASVNNFNDGTVVIYNYLPYQTHFDTIQVVPIDVNGDYHFSSIDHGSYLIKVFPNSVTYPTAVPTYYGNQFLWTDATIINHDCNLNDTSNISVIFPQGALVGPGALGGMIREGLGFIRQEGDPIPGLDVKLGKNPGGQIMASTQTDNNGYYYFPNLPLNSTGESYIVYADIPGLGRDSSYNVVLDPTHPLYDSLNYLVDSTTIYIVPTSSTGINTITHEATSHFSIYPNPFKGTAGIEYNISKEADVTLEVMNVLGVKIRSLVNSRQSAGNHKCNLNNQNNQLSPGIYFITLTIDGKETTQRVVVME